MKKIHFLFIVLALSLTACSSDDDSSNDTSGSIVGTWIGVDLNHNGTTVTEIPGGDDITANFVVEAYDMDYSITFTENPNELTSDGSYSLETTTTVLGQTQTQNFENIEYEGVGTWSKVGDQLTMANEGETSVATIIELTNTNMTMVQEFEIVEASQGFTTNTVTIITSTFTRM